MKKAFWTSEKLLSISAIVVSLMTLIVFSYQTSLMQKQQYMSVYPYLDTSNRYSGTLKYNYTLSNNGIGPAFIESVTVTDSMQQTYDGIADYIVSQGIDQDSIWFFNSDLNPGQLIPANEKIPLIQIVNEDMLTEFGITNFEDLPMNTTDDAGALHQIINSDNLIVEIVYSSVYGERWKIDNTSSAPLKLE